MGRLLARLLGALTLGLGVLALLPQEAVAYSQARLLARDDALALRGRELAGADADAELLADAWLPRGGAVAAAVAAAMRLDDAPDGTVTRGSRLFSTLCNGVGVSVGGASLPAAGDPLLFLQRGGADEGRLRAGIFLDAEEALVVDPSTGIVVEVPRQRLFGDDRAGVEADLALPGTARSCSVSAALVADAGDITSHPGAVALLDPGTSAQRLAWAAAHPRDGDTSLLHAAAGMLVGLPGALLRGILVTTTGIGLVAGAAAGLAGDLLDRLHGRLPLPLSLLSGVEGLWALRRLLGATVDVSGLHSLLAGGLAAQLLGGLAIPLGAAAALGWATGWWSPRRVLGIAWAAAWTTAVFAVDLLTGLDGTGHTPVLGIAVAVVGDAVVLLKPLAALRALPGAARLLGGFAGLGGGAAPLRGLRGAGRLVDLVGAKPGALAETLGIADRVGAAAWLSLQGESRGGGAAAAAAARSLTDADLGRDLLVHLANLGSSAWRGPASLGADSLTYTARLAQVLSHDGELLGSPSTLARAGARALDGLDAQTQAVLRAAFPALRELSEVAHLHSGAVAIANLAQGKRVSGSPQ